MFRKECTINSVLEAMHYVTKEELELCNEDYNQEIANVYIYAQHKQSEVDTEELDLITESNLPKMLLSCDMLASVSKLQLQFSYKK